MLLAWEEEVTPGFWMKDTLLSLDLFFFGADGAIVDETSLEPCRADPCPVFVADGLFRWVLEAPAGSLEATGKLSFPAADCLLDTPCSVNFGSEDRSLPRLTAGCPQEEIDAHLRGDDYPSP